MVSWYSGGIDLELSLEQLTENPSQWNNYSVQATLTNNGNQTATGVVVDFPAPEGVVYVGADPFEVVQGTFYPFSNELWNVGSVPPGSSYTLTVNYFLLAAEAAAAYAQVQSANENDSDSTPGNGTPPAVNEDDEASTDDGPNGFVDLELSAYVEQSGNYGQSRQFDFYLELTNAGTLPATGVGVSIENLLNILAPQAADFEPSQGTYTIGASPERTVGTVNAGQTTTLKISLRRIAGAGPIGISAQVFSQNEPDIDSTPGNGYSDEDDELSFWPERPCEIAVDILDVQCVPSDDSPALDEIYFDIAVSGAPDGWKIFFELYNPANTSGAGDGLFTVGPIPRYMVEVGSKIYDQGFPGCFTDFADFNILDGIDCLMMTGQPDLELSVEIDASEILPAQNLFELAIKVKNTGTAAASGITVGITALEHANLFPNSILDLSQGNLDLNTAIWNVGSLAAGEDASLLLKVNSQSGGFIDPAFFIFVEVLTQNEEDLDSSPGNGNAVNALEDDEATAPERDCNIAYEILDYYCVPDDHPSNPIFINDEFYFNIEVSNAPDGWSIWLGLGAQVIKGDGDGVFSIGPITRYELGFWSVFDYGIPFCSTLEPLSSAITNAECEVPTDPCEAVGITINSGMIAITNVNAPHFIKKVFNSNWTTELDCVDDNCDDPSILDGLAGGTYYIQIQLFDESWQPICTFEEFAEVPPGSIPQGFVQQLRPGLPVQISKIQPNPVLHNQTEVLIFAQTATQQQLHCFNLLGGAGTILRFDFK